MATIISPPEVQLLLPALLASLPAAAVSSLPPTAILPLLCPILRQRVQILSATSKDPWLPLLCYNSNAGKLEGLVKSDKFEPHPASGEVEVDWDDVSIHYRRVDNETLQARVLMTDFALQIGLVYCVEETEGGANGWRIGDLNVLSTPKADAQLYHPTILAAEASFTQQQEQQQQNTANTRKQAHLHARSDAEAGQEINPSSWHIISASEEVEGRDDDDDAYWAQYDNNSTAITPAAQPSPVPGTQGSGSNVPGASSEETYYARYAQVQPALDREDPNEVAQNGAVESTLGKENLARSLRENMDSHPEFTQAVSAWDSAESSSANQQELQEHQHQQQASPCAPETPYSGQIIAQPRPASSTGSTGSATVARLEQTAARQNQSEIGVKQHVATTLKSLYRLARAAGIERVEFSRLVSTELELLGVGEGDD
ncbi:MAG: hypothetical protein M1818_000823 [Claussenomyces sp. TS43310]|nr:MAG: hypothetical protein M1818_000823 [Claussenomyces sp. TS43310]